MYLIDSQFLPVLNLNLIYYQSSAICLKRTGHCWQQSQNRDNMIKYCQAS